MVENTSRAELDPLSSPVDPCKFEVHIRLDNCSEGRKGVEPSTLNSPFDPVEDVEEAVATKGEEVV